VSVSLQLGAKPSFLPALGRPEIRGFLPDPLLGRLQDGRWFNLLLTPMVE
jgi:hypothetical protein